MMPFSACHRKVTTTCLLLIILLSCQSASGILAKSQLCEVEKGQSNIIVDIEESRGNYTGQATTPPELPIFGDPYEEIALQLVFQKDNPAFTLSGKKLQLLQPLDRDEENLSHIVFQVACTVRDSKKKRNIPIIVRVSDVNDNAPRFMNTPYEVTVPESTPVGTTIFRNIQALDKDAGVNGLVKYFIVEANQTESLGSQDESQGDKLAGADGYGTFAISFPHQGQVTVAKTLDYERTRRYYLTIVASDRARNVSERLSSTTTLLINIADSDDLDPSFIYRDCVLLDGACINPQYTASVPAGALQGVLAVLPERIQAIDLDSIGSRIRYSFDIGTPSNYADYFEIDEWTGVLKQIKAVDTSTAKKYDIMVRAEEVSVAKRFATAKLVIDVKPVDANPPVITASSVEGYVDENSAIGVQVTDAMDHPISFSTSDADLGEDDSKPDYIYELTTPSFTVSSDGVLVVNEDGLDRDPPSPGRFQFQVVAREPRTNAASAPLSLVVHLRDINDNAPRIGKIPPVEITAGDERRVIAQVTATDNDEGVNALVTFSIVHVSKNGMKKFTIDANSGQIEAVGKLIANEKYGVTVQATDSGGLSSQTIVEIAVIPGPNTKPPMFSKPIYDVQVSEGADINSTVAVVHAEDPESDPVQYSIISGNDLRQFSVNKESGVITVIRKLDRESLTRYQLILSAEDNGGLSSTAIVNIKVTDINDKNPEFDDSTLPYVFQVDEGKTNEYVGTVYATDGDEGINAQITFFIPNDVPFVINGSTGELRTATKLDYEQEKEFKFVVTAKDGAPDARQGTASVTVLVRDLPDEPPKFTDSRIDVRVPENEAGYLITTVQAIDPDSMPEITYTLKKGDGQLFKVSATSGEVRTAKALDYEKQRRHELVIGTMENNGTTTRDTVAIVVEVEDRNDVRPMFITVPEPVTISDDLPVGALVAMMPAIDSDGTSPGNVVRYELIGRGKALQYFQVDAESGAVRLRDDLRKEAHTEYQADIRAYDMGEPQLSSVATLPISVRRKFLDLFNDGATTVSNNDNMNSSATSTPESSIGLAFSDERFDVAVPESTPVNTTIRHIHVLNAKYSGVGNPALKCEITKGSALGLFEVNVQDHGCGIVLVKALDFERQTSYTLELRLSSQKYFINPEKGTAIVKITVEDVNDNAPEFIVGHSLRRNDTYYAVVPIEMAIGGQVLRVQAVDRDSGKFGAVRYTIVDENDNDIKSTNTATNYFTIDADTGSVRLSKQLPKDAAFPATFQVEARDNDGQANEFSHGTRVRVVVNLLLDANRMALVFSDAGPNELHKQRAALETLLGEKTGGLIIGIERFSKHKFIGENGSVIENSSATDVWFYVIDPTTERILNRNDAAIQVTLIDPTAQSELNFAASSLAHATAEGIYAPIESRQQVHKVKAAIALDDEVFPYALIAISIIILILGICGIIYICISWSKYKNFKQRMRQYSTPSPSRYDPVIVNSQPGNGADALVNLKEYETQMLAMAVPSDGDDDLQIDFSAKNHAFSLDNVSYITHKERASADSQSSPSHSDVTTATIATLRRHSILNNHISNNNLNIMNNRQNTHGHAGSNANPLASVSYGTLPGTLTLGRIKHQNSGSTYQNGGSTYKLDGRNNLSSIHNNGFNTTGRRGNTFGGNAALQRNGELITNTLGQNNRNYGNEVPITNPIFQRSSRDINLVSATNDNVTYAKRDYGQSGFSYLNDLERSEVETTTEL